ncbi:MAG: hypothetical protein FD145_1082 [Candidatus Saganbacteria bacterium]|uniref:Uncharacterized protein n=1 Tax=Candidatus Saganbacteria bacterium TaxID=2575572 RepID=A0A833NZR1_UNCSA|nr:MAG: hypothetical protein FD145_1082 [Candidatus Saganbacteria bacterium]
MELSQEQEPLLERLIQEGIISKYYPATTKDARDYYIQKPNTPPNDILITHEFLSQFPDQVKKRVIAAKPGAIIKT